MKTLLTRVPTQASRDLAVALLLISYLPCLGFILRVDRGPVGYEAFTAIGLRLLPDGDPYEPDCSSPLTFAMLFAMLSALPRALSMAVCLLALVTVSLIAAGWQLRVLLFVPGLAPYCGGQTDGEAPSPAHAPRRHVGVANLKEVALAA